MADLIPFYTFTDTDKQVIATLISVLLGSIGTYLISEKVRKKQKKDDEEKQKKLDDAAEITRLKGQIVAHMQAMDGAQHNLHQMLIMALKNKGHVRDASRGIIDPKTGTTHFNMNLAVPYRIREGLSDNLLNSTAVIQWTALETEVLLHNTIINEFNENYSFVRNNIHTAKLAGSNIDQPTILSDNSSIASGAGSVMDAIDAFKDRCIAVLAIIDCNMVLLKKIDYKSISPSDLEKYRNKLVSHKVDEKDLEAMRAKHEDQFTEEKAFAVNSALADK